MNLWKVVIACSTWGVLNLLTVMAIQGGGSMETNFPNAFSKWQWELLHLFMIPIVYPIFIYGLPLYISGVVPILINKIQKESTK